MGALATTHPTLLDVTKRLDPKGQIDRVAEILNETNEILDDMVWIEGNLETGHRTTVRTGIPTPTWRKLYGGVQPTKSETAQITDTCGMLEAYAEVDKALADLNGNTAAWRMSEERPHIHGMGIEIADTLFAGNEATEPEAFTGLEARFNDQSANNGENILTSAATPDATDNTSLWIVVWGPNTIHGIYPRGSKAGLQMEDKGQVTIEDIDSAGGRMEAYRSHYRWDAGLCVRDWRYVVRVQYDLEDIVAGAGSGPDLFQLLGKGLRRIPSLNAGRACIYGNRDSLDALDLQANARSTLAYRSFEDAQGKMINAFRGVPIKRCDQITSTETGI